jgi:hypothetical protein
VHSVEAPHHRRVPIRESGARRPLPGKTFWECAVDRPGVREIGGLSASVS